MTELIALPEESESPLLAYQSHRVLLVDATTLYQLGGDGDDWRLHTGYNLGQGRIDHLKLTDKYTGEDVAHVDIAENDILVADRTYGYRKSVALVRDKHAHGVFRFHPKTLPLYATNGQRVDMMRDLARHPEGWDRSVLVEYDGTFYLARMVVMPLPEAEAAKARSKLRRDAKRKGRQVTKESLRYAGYLFVVTTLPIAAWSTREILRLYRARWQVELLFKRMKQLIRLNEIRATTRAAVEATVRAVLIAWMLQETVKEEFREACAKVREFPPDKDLLCGLSEEYTSSWTLTALCVDTLRMNVRGGWNFARVRHCLPRLLRYVQQRRRNRTHQEQAVRQWLKTKQPRAIRRHKPAA